MKKYLELIAYSLCIYCIGFISSVFIFAPPKEYGPAYTDTSRVLMNNDTLQLLVTGNGSANYTTRFCLGDTLGIDVIGKDITTDIVTLYNGGGYYREDTLTFNVGGDTLMLNAENENITIEPIDLSNYIDTFSTNGIHYLEADMMMPPPFDVEPVAIWAVDDDLLNYYHMILCIDKLINY